MAVESYSAAALARRATTLAVALMVLSSGVYFGIQSADNSSSIVQQVKTSDGRVKMVITSSGSITSTGSLTIRGTMSGASTMTLSPLGNAPTFKVLCPKAGGVIGTMTVTATGTVLKTCN